MSFFRNDFLLLSKWLLLNILGSFLFFFLYKNGWVTTIISSDISFITPTILILVAFALLLSGYWAYTVSRELKMVRQGEINSVLKKFYENPNKFNFSDGKNLESLKLLFSNRIAALRYIAWTLVVMGITGTIIGFIIVLLSIDPSQVANLETLPAALAKVTSGLGVALYTTLAGTVGNLWIMVNYFMLSTATVQLYSYIIVNHEIVEDV